MSTIAAVEKPPSTATNDANVHNKRNTINRNSLNTRAAIAGQALSGYEKLTVYETVKKFKFNAFVCFMMTFSAATDGYQIG
jgi:hypothetical protein